MFILKFIILVHSSKTWKKFILSLLKVCRVQNLATIKLGGYKRYACNNSGCATFTFVATAK